MQNGERYFRDWNCNSGIIDQNEKTVLKSHALQVENYSLRFLEQALGFPVYFENDANSAMLAEDTQKYNNAIYLSLNHTLGGAFCIDGNCFVDRTRRQESLDI